MPEKSFRTPIQCTTSRFNLDHSHTIIALGSCFSAHIGQKLIQSKFRVLINPFGTLFDPISIHQLLRWEHLESDEATLMYHQGYWHAVQYHGAFKDRDKDRLMEKIYQTKVHLLSWLNHCHTIILTYGTAHVWKLQEKDNIVGNCHKLPGDFFYRELLSPELIASELSGSITALKNKFPDINFILTISPVRHLNMGLIENQLSKSVLRVAVASLIHKLPEIYYFPAYEIMMDDLRDYRFYADDMIHPSELATEYIFEEFKAVFFNEETKKRIKIWSDFRKALNHRPLDNDNEQWKKYKQDFSVRLQQFKKDFPLLDWKEEEAFCDLS
jgi:hypothetical protein